MRPRPPLGQSIHPLAGRTNPAEGVVPLMRRCRLGTRCAVCFHFLGDVSSIHRRRSSTRRYLFSSRTRRWSVTAAAWSGADRNRHFSKCARTDRPLLRPRQFTMRVRFTPLISLSQSQQQSRGHAQLEASVTRPLHTFCLSLLLFPPLPPLPLPSLIIRRASPVSIRSILAWAMGAR
jgi:hypothetical protein